MFATPLAVRCRATKLVLAGCLLLGAGLFIKIDKTGFMGANFLGRTSRAPAPVMQYGSMRDMGSQDTLNSNRFFNPEGRHTPYGQQYGRGTTPVGGRGSTPSWNGGRWGQSGQQQGFGNFPIEVQGESLRTWSFEDPRAEVVQVDLSTIGRPLNATVEVWNGNSNTPIQVRAYSDDGELRPFSAVLAIPRAPSTVAVRNKGQVEFPITASVDQFYVERPSFDHQNFIQNIEGGALRTYPMSPDVEAVEVVIETDGRPLNARIEILQGPNTDKQVIELYTDDGMERPFFATLATPWFGGGNSVVKIINTGPVEFPLLASVVPADPRRIDGAREGSRLAGSGRFAGSRFL
jgi:hypothetical protein